MNDENEQAQPSTSGERPRIVTADQRREELGLKPKATEEQVAAQQSQEEVNESDGQQATDPQSSEQTDDETTEAPGPVTETVDIVNEPPPPPSDAE